jgi:hypothetical protein
MKEGTVYAPAVDNSLRAPAYPLVTIDPYTSAWSFADKLNENVVQHWTGKEHSLTGAVRVDDKSYRFLGNEKKETTDEALFRLAATQTAAVVMPTQTFYTFECGGIRLDVIFTAPFLMDDLDVMASPYNYITYQVRAIDGKSHEVQIYLEATPQWAVHTESQKVIFGKVEKEGLVYLKTGTEEQAVLGKKGDDVRIDWGYFYLAGKKSDEIKMNLGDSISSNMQQQMTVLSYMDNLGKVSSKHRSGYLLIGYDDLYSIQYFGENLLPYWKRDGKTDVYAAYSKGFRSYADIMERCSQWDAQLMKDAVEAGGQKYAELCALAYRQAIAAHKLVTDKEGNLLFLSKENFSNGSIGTVDVTYPSAPLFLLYNPELLKGMLNPIFYFSESGKWKKPFPAHDVGTYPLANGQTYGGDMPVEECGNMLILTAAVATMEGNADYAARHWDVLTTWADYLLKEGLDPANQLCTDDFAGHFAHNANLSVKAIEGIACYGKLAEMLGKKEIASQYTDTAHEMASKWIKMADDGDHYRLAFDKPGTWSQKYNLIWDRMLGLNIFPKDIAEKELAYYLTKQNVYGLPLDNREDYTKSDWILWTACLTDSAEHFDALMQRVWKYVDETPSRVPMSDWYFTSTAKQRGFQARSVVGGYFMRLLQHELMHR